MGSAEKSPENGEKDTCTEKEEKYERSSLLPTKVPRTSPDNIPESELRSKIHGLQDSFFVWGLWTSFQKAKGYRQAAKANSVYLDESLCLRI